MTVIDEFYNSFPNIGLQRGNMAVEWSYEDEGYSGYYDEEDPQDKQLLRFYVYVLAPGAKADKLCEDENGVIIKEDVDDASYCTNVRMKHTNEERLKELLVIIMDQVYDEDANIENPPRIKKTCERLSWISDTVKELEDF